MSKFKQDEVVYFRISKGIEGYATVAGDYDLIVILKPEKPLNNYSHIYVSKTQIINKEAPVVPQEAEENELPFQTGMEPPPNEAETYPQVQEGNG